jgi:hypothetical protein
MDDRTREIPSGVMTQRPGSVEAVGQNASRETKCCAMGETASSKAKAGAGSRKSGQVLVGKDCLPAAANWKMTGYRIRILIAIQVMEEREKVSPRRRSCAPMTCSRRKHMNRGRNATACHGAKRKRYSIWGCGEKRTATPRPHGTPQRNTPPHYLTLISLISR